MKKLFIAEKPNYAKNIVNAFQSEKFQRKNGYFESEHQIITWAYGHLFQLLDIEDYLHGESKSWTLNNLPYYPEPFKFQLKKDVKTKRTDDGVKKQFAIIKELVQRKDVDEIVHAGDADREGEVIVRLILEYIQNDKPVKRLWCNDQTPDAIREQISHLKDDKEFDSLYAEGLARTYIDWLYGINGTRLVTLKTNTFLNIGRVITAIVLAIHKRDKEIKEFTPEQYYSIVSKEYTNGEIIELVSKNTYPLEQKGTALHICESYNQEQLIVKNIETKRMINTPGKLFSLSKLQGVLAKKYKFSMKKSLDIVQKLYENGYVSYPRTNSEYLATTELGKISNLVNKLKGKYDYNIELKNKKMIFDDSKIESHSAICPTNIFPDQEELTEDENKVYQTILNRFLAVFCSTDCIVDKTTIFIAAGELEVFKLIGNTIVEKGYLQYDQNNQNKGVSLPKLTIGERVNSLFNIQIKETQPLKHYTVETLNNYLKNPFKKTNSEAGEDVQDDRAEYNAITEGLEIGTEATRSGIIDNAIRIGYIDLKGNTYHILDKGEYLVNALNKLEINFDKEKTAIIGKILKQVYRNELTIEESVDLAKEEINNMFKFKSTEMNAYQSEKEVIGKCPLCGANIFENKQGYSCENNKKEQRTCSFMLWKNDSFFAAFSKTITSSMAKSMLSKGKVNCSKLVSKKSGKVFNGIISVEFGEGRINYDLSFPCKK